MLTEELQKEIYFPYSKVRDIQTDMISDVHNAIKSKKHIIMHAPTGIGKTIAVTQILREMEDQTDEIFPLYINCWQKNTTYKILMEICDLLGYRFPFEEFFCGKADIMQRYDFNGSKIKRWLYKFNSKAYEQFI